MRRFRLSEKLFLSMGLVLVLAASLALHYKVSFVKILKYRGSAGDPFEASYYSEPILLASPSPTASPFSGESSKIGIFLISPTNFSLLPYKANLQILFQFEVYPKATECTFELLFRDQVITQKQLPASSASLRVITLPITEPGLYQWRVKSADFTTELRTFTVRRNSLKK